MCLVGVENRLQTEIDEINEQIGEGIPDVFMLTLIGSTIGVTNAESLPAVNVQFDLSFFSEGIEHAPSGNFTATIDGFPLHIEDQPTLREGINTITVSITLESTRQNIIRRAAVNGRIDFQLRRGGEISNILHVPLHDVFEQDRYSVIPNFTGTIAENTNVTMASFAGLTIGKRYDITLDINCLLYTSPSPRDS